MVYYYIGLRNVPWLDTSSHSQHVKSRQNTLQNEERAFPQPWKLWSRLFYTTATGMALGIVTESKISRSHAHGSQSSSLDEKINAALGIASPQISALDQLLMAHHCRLSGALPLKRCRWCEHGFGKTADFCNWFLFLVTVDGSWELCPVPRSIHLNHYVVI